MVKDSSVIAIEVFDQRSKQRNQGLLGSVNIPVAQYLNVDLDGHGMSFQLQGHVVFSFYDQAIHPPQRW